MMITKYKNWKEILWNNIQLEIYNLQHKIYCHAKNNQISLIRSCQRKLVNLEESKLLAVRYAQDDQAVGVDDVDTSAPKPPPDPEHPLEQHHTARQLAARKTTRPAAQPKDPRRSAVI